MITQLTVCFIKEPTEFEESPLSCDLSRRPDKTNAGFVLITSLSRTFLTNNDIFFMIGQHHCVRCLRNTDDTTLKKC